MNGEYVVVMAFGLIGNVLPITREQDYKAKDTHSNYYGQPMSKQYDVHYAQVDPAADTE